MGPEKIVTLIFLFSRDASITSALQMLEGGVSKTAIIEWYIYFRGLMSRYMLDNRLVLGGVGETVEIDESLFRGRRKYNVGRILPHQPWVFGAIERSSNKVVVFTVDARNRQVLEDRIDQCITPGTTIISDEWAAYNQLNNINNYTHHTVNHTQNFVDLLNPDVHTQTIEGFWGNAK